MRWLIFFLSIVVANSAIAQSSRENKLSLKLYNNFYSYGEGQGNLNNVVRLGEGFGFSFKTYDTSKKRTGMIYVLNTINTTAYYKNVLSSGSILEVNDLHANLNFIFPILILSTNRIDHYFGVGIGLATLVNRDYYDENNTVLPYNSTNLQEIKFGKYWTSSFLLDYELSLQLYRKVGLNLGLRYTSASPISNSSRVNFKISQGSSFGFNYGLYYQF